MNEEIDMNQSLSCCWRCESSDVGVEETAVESDIVVVQYVCNDCYSTWESKYEHTTVFIAAQ